MQVGVQFADFIEKQGAAVGLFELAFLGFGGAGKGAFLMTKKRRFKQGIRNRRAVKRHVGFVRPVRKLMDLAGKNILADARFSE